MSAAQSTPRSGESPTEARNPHSIGLDSMSALEIVQLMNAEDVAAVRSVGDALADLAELVDATVQRVRAGGRVHYFGAGTPGRLGVLDAAELIPTFGADPHQVQAHLAGGHEALVRAVEGSEDSESQGRHEAALAVEEGDVVIGLAASGTTPYVAGALSASREAGALTALVTSNPKSPLAVEVDHAVIVRSGPEVLTGSTRLKAGTVTKLILNSFSTALMVKLGRTYSNLMVTVVPGNTKLRERSLRILHEVSGASPARTAELLDEAGGDLPVALVSCVAAVSTAVAAQALASESGSVGDAIRSLRPGAAR